MNPYAIALFLCLLTPGGGPAHTGAGSAQGDYLTVGIFLGSIEEGARIFTPIRLLPFEHPEAEGHEFPNALVLHRSEYEVITDLGGEIGLSLGVTLQRYPRLPIDAWSYEGFERIPASTLAGAAVAASPEPPPLPGLRAAVFHRGAPVVFIVDTRGVSLEARGMSRPTAMGLDLSRAEFLAALEGAGASYAGDDWIKVTFGSNTAP